MTEVLKQVPCAPLKWSAAALFSFVIVLGTDNLLARRRITFLDRRGDGVELGGDTAGPRAKAGPKGGRGVIP
jgi:hypothetical protein